MAKDDERDSKKKESENKGRESKSESKSKDSKEKDSKSRDSKGGGGKDGQNKGGGEGDDSFLESMRNSPAYGPVGIILAAFAWYALKKLIDQIPCVDSAQLRRTLLALLFSGVYIYIWTQGKNPHDAEITPNTIETEIPLLLAGGYYLSHVYPQKYPSTSAHHFFSVIAILAVIYNGEGAEAANTFGFLVEAPNVFLALRGCVSNLESGMIDCVLNFVYPLIFILAKFVALSYHTYLIITSEVSMPLKVLTAVLTLFSYTLIGEVVYEAYTGQGKRRGRGRRTALRSSSRSRSRSRSKIHSGSKRRGRRCR